MPIFSWILIIICALVILAIIIKKFPALALLDVNSIPGEKEARFKDQIIQQKVERDISRVSGLVARAYLALSRYIGRLFHTTQAQLKKLQISYKSTAKISQSERESLINSLLASSDDLLKKENVDEAEEKLLEVISLDQKNCLAFFKLASLYEDEKKWLEARQTYEHALKLAKQCEKEEEGLTDLTIQEIYFSLAYVEKETGDLEAALENIREALEREPNSPRYLDLILDLSIMKKDKGLAWTYFNKMSTINPENNKLQTWREQIMALGEDN